MTENRGCPFKELQLQAPLTQNLWLHAAFEGKYLYLPCFRLSQVQIASCNNLLPRLPGIAPAGKLSSRPLTSWTRHFKRVIGFTGFKVSSQSESAVPFPDRWGAHVGRRGLQTGSGFLVWGRWAFWLSVPYAFSLTSIPASTE